MKIEAQAPRAAPAVVPSGRPSSAPARTWTRPPAGASLPALDGRVACWQMTELVTKTALYAPVQRLT